MSESKSLFETNIALLKQGKLLLGDISDDQYAFAESPYYNSGVGKHMRHILEHYVSLANGWNRKVDYDARERNTEVEYRRSLSIEKIQQLIDHFEHLKGVTSSTDQKVLVRSNEAENDPDSPWSSSTIKRELQFLVSHTVHHYALIDFILRTQGVSLPENFGVAPSTLHYQNEQVNREHS